jgi:hypothetical protein
MLTDPGYAARVRAAGAWRTEVLTAHRQVTGLHDRGRLAVPWPRALGTPPWAIARRLRAEEGRRWRTGVVWPWRRAAVLAGVRRACDGGDPVVLYVGSRLLPRHVVLVLAVTPLGLRVWDPARGATTTVTDAGFLGPRLGLGRWEVPWFAVGPPQPSASSAA